MSKKHETPVMVTRSSLPPLEEYVEMLKPIWESAWLTNMGEYHEELKRQLKRFLKATDLELFVNGHMALELALQAMNLEGEVITTPFTFASTTHAIVRNGLTPVFCDINDRDYTMDAEKIEDLITEKTCAIVPVHVYGNICDVDRIHEIAQKHGLKVIYDAAHAFGCKHHGRKIGSFGDMVCFSFDGIKNITCGEGGCLVAFEAEAAHLASDARLLSVENDAQKRFAGARSWDPDVKRQGWRYHMSNIMAAIGRVQLSRLEAEFIPARRALAARYAEKLASVPGVALLHTDPQDFIVPHIMPVRILHGRKDEVKDALAARNLPTGVHYKPNHLLSCFSTGQSLPVTEQLYAELVTLPMHPGLTTEDVDAICEGVAQALAR